MAASSSSHIRGQRPRRVRTANVVLALGVCAAIATWWVGRQSVAGESQADSNLPAFVATPSAASASGSIGQSGRALLSSRSGREGADVVAMRLKSGRYQGGVPDRQEIERRRIQTPQVNNMKDQYFIIWIRSAKVKNWYPINIISGSEAAKTLKNVKDSSIAKAVGGDKLADYQIVRAIGMQLYQQKDEVKKQALNMHAPLKYAQNFQFGYKEIVNNTKFNDDPSEDMLHVNISIIPPEEELRNLLDDAGDAIKGAGDTVSKVGDNIKGFFGGAGR